VHEFPNVTAACHYARTQAAAGDRIVVSGSFITVAEAMSCHV
jgi:folylpolyglutamate synthase/dihydropteroate synthase